MFEAAFKNIDNALRKDENCSTELDYIEQTSWILFLKYLDDYENQKEEAAFLNGENYSRIITGDFAWTAWATPKKEDGSVDRNAIQTGDDLRDFVNDELFPHLENFTQTANNPRTIEYKIGKIFSELSNKLQSGYVLREVVEKIDSLVFLSNENKHELSNLYEDKIKNMGNAGRNGGEYYTPRPLIKSIVKIINPKIGETVYDGAVGSAGFLCEAYAHMRVSKNQLTSKDIDILQTKTFLGKEKKPLAYIIGIMNMILHGIEAPNIIRKNTLTENLNDIQDKDRMDVILANPPFGGGKGEGDEIQQNFPIPTGETAYLFLQHFIKMLKAGGRAGVIIKSTFLSNTDKACALRKELLKECNLFAVLDLPSGVFTGAGVKTVVLFFEKGKPTKKIWYYQLNLERNLGKKNPLNEDDLAEFTSLCKKQETSENSWLVDISDINQDTWDLSAKNPNRPDETDNRTPHEIITEIEALDVQATKALQAIKKLS